MKLKYVFTFALTAWHLQGCATPEADPAPAFDLVMTTAPIGTYETDCSRVFTPTPEAEPYVAAAVERWSQATGCDVRIGEGGIPVAMAPEIISDKGDMMTGVSNRANCEVYEVFIAEYSTRKYETALHEVGHALHSPCDAAHAHTETGIMTYNSREDRIDEASLSLICEGFDCRAFNTEQI